MRTKLTIDLQHFYRHLRSQKINYEVLKDGDVFMTAVLGSYVVVYCEYRGENRDLLKEWDWSYFHGLSSDETTKERISNLQNKYSFIANKYRIEVLDSSHVKQIIHEIETGQSLKAYVEKSLSQLQGKVSLQDKLAEFFNLSIAGPLKTEWVQPA